MKEKKILTKKIFFHTYLPNQKIQGKGAANKQFFKDGPASKITWRIIEQMFLFELSFQNVAGLKEASSTDPTFIIMFVCRKLDYTGE